MLTFINQIFLSLLLFFVFLGIEALVLFSYFLGILRINRTIEACVLGTPE